MSLERDLDLAVRPIYLQRAGREDEKVGRETGVIQENTVALKLEQKQAIVAEVNEAAGNALSAVVADYRGLTVGQMTELRAKARTSGVYLKVVRNTLAKRAMEGTDYECLKSALVGPILVAFSQQDPGAAARALPAVPARPGLVVLQDRKSVV